MRRHERAAPALDGSGRFRGPEKRPRQRQDMHLCGVTYFTVLMNRMIASICASVRTPA